jgi:hypothetical protein
MKAFTFVNPVVRGVCKVEVTSTPAESSFFRALALAMFKIVKLTSFSHIFRISTFDI